MWCKIFWKAHGHFLQSHLNACLSSFTFQVQRALTMLVINIWVMQPAHMLRTKIFHNQHDYHSEALCCRNVNSLGELKHAQAWIGFLSALYLNLFDYFPWMPNSFSKIKIHQHMNCLLKWPMNWEFINQSPRHFHHFNPYSQAITAINKSFDIEILSLFLCSIDEFHHPIIQMNFAIS